MLKMKATLPSLIAPNLFAVVAQVVASLVFLLGPAFGEGGAAFHVLKQQLRARQDGFQCLGPHVIVLVAVCHQVQCVTLAFRLQRLILDAEEALALVAGQFKIGWQRRQVDNILRW